MFPLLNWHLILSNMNARMKTWGSIVISRSFYQTNRDFIIWTNSNLRNRTFYSPQWILGKWNAALFQLCIAWLPITSARVCGNDSFSCYILFSINYHKVGTCRITAHAIGSNFTTPRLTKKCDNFHKWRLNKKSSLKTARKTLLMKTPILWLANFSAQFC